MTNKELYETFSRLRTQHDNIFDIYCALKSWEKNYQTTEFYRMFKKSIYEAYELYMQNGGKIDTIINLLDNVDDNNKLDVLVNKFAAAFDMENIMNSMSADNKSLLTQVLPYVSK